MTFLQRTEEAWTNTRCWVEFTPSEPGVPGSSHAHPGNELGLEQTQRTRMGTFQITVEIADPRGEQFEAVEMLVGTGATFTKVPRDLLERLGVPAESTYTAVLVDGSRAERTWGRTVIQMEGKEFPTLVTSGPAHTGSGDRQNENPTPGHRQDQSPRRPVREGHGLPVQLDQSRRASGPPGHHQTDQ